MKIAHISDIHFFSPKISLKHFFSKEIIGKVNANIRRKNFFITAFLDRFLASLIKENVDVLLITGDFTTTAEESEFQLAKEFIEDVLGSDIKVFALPGNHDAYTKKAYKTKLFYQYLDILPTFSNEHLHFESLSPSWDLILLDNTISNRPFIAKGAFTKAHEKTLKDLLKDSKNIIVANHFPLESDHKHHKLERGETLKKILSEHDGTVLYLHGHTHKTTYHEEKDNLHIFNSSEITVKHKFKYHIIDLKDDTFTYKEIKYFD